MTVSNGPQETATFTFIAHGSERSFGRLGLFARSSFFKLPGHHHGGHLRHQGPHGTPGQTDRQTSQQKGREGRREDPLSRDLSMRRKDRDSLACSDRDLKRNDDSSDIVGRTSVRVAKREEEEDSFFYRPYVCLLVCLLLLLFGFFLLLSSVGRMSAVTPVGVRGHLGSFAVLPSVRLSVRPWATTTFARR